MRYRVLILNPDNQLCWGVGALTLPPYSFIATNAYVSTPHACQLCQGGWFRARGGALRVEAHVHSWAALKWRMAMRAVPAVRAVQTAVRTVKEETGLDLADCDQVGQGF